MSPNLYIFYIHTIKILTLGSCLARSYWSVHKFSCNSVEISEESLSLGPLCRNINFRYKILKCQFKILYPVPSNWLVYKFLSKFDEILILGPLMLMVLNDWFISLRQSVTCFSLLLTGYSWLVSRYFRFLISIAGYLWLLLVTSNSSF